MVINKIEGKTEKKEGIVFLNFAGYRSFGKMVFNEIKEDFYNIEFYNFTEIVFSYKKDTIEKITNDNNSIVIYDTTGVIVEVQGIKKW